MLTDQKHFRSINFMEACPATTLVLKSTFVKMRARPQKPQKMNNDCNFNKSVEDKRGKR